MNKLNEVFDILPHDPEPNSNLPAPVVVSNDENAEDSDFKYTRQNQVDLIEVSKAAVQTAMKVASESESPKAIEALAMMLKTASEMNRQLVLQSKDKAETKAAKKGTGTAVPSIGSAQTVNNIVMTGTMQDMLDQLKALKNAT